MTRCLGALRAAGRPALIPYLPAGHPSVAATRELLGSLRGVADAVEVGIPFSDPVADGPVIQQASHRALANGMTPAGVLELVAAARSPVPVVLFSYVNPVLQYGPAAFLRDAAAAGASALLLTDLPAGADPALEDAVRASALDLIPLVAPTTTPARLGRIVAGAQGFIYLVARLGVTGTSATLADGLEASVAAVRAATPLPVAVGFGVSTPAQAARLGTLADGVVVGSALVERLGTRGVDGGLAFLAGLRAALDASRRPVGA